MSHQTPQDIPLFIIVPSPTTTPSNATSQPPLITTERRITPSWSISHLKSRLEPITGIPSSSQSLRIKPLSTTSNNVWVTISDDSSLVSDPRWNLRRGSEIYVFDTRPAGSRVDFSDVSKVAKYEMPEEQYEKLEDSVLAWKRRQKLGRFDPSAGDRVAERRERDEREVESRGVEVGRRARVGGDDGRRGTVRFVGEVKGLGGEREEGCVWVGVELDEPVGRNDGSVEVDVDVNEEGGGKRGKRLFECRDKFGVLVRPEKVEVGEWPVLDDLEVDEDMEEI